MLKQKKIFRLRSEIRILLISLLLVIPLGFYTKAYNGIARDWVNNSLAGVFYEIFWILLFALLCNRCKPFSIAATVFIATSILEILQLWDSPFLELLRSYFLGRTILGNTFVWSDFFYYLIGSSVGYIWLRIIKKSP